jgi:hypothetical protein
MYFVSNNYMKIKGTFEILETWRNKALNVYYNWEAKLRHEWMKSFAYMHMQLVLLTQRKKSMCLVLKI